MSTYDVIVVGARCAGAPTAMLLARRGHRVLIVDRAAFPSDTLSTHFMRPMEMQRLGGWGVLDEVLASGCPPMRTVTLYSAGILLSGSPPLPPGIAGAYAPRRTVLDKALIESAVAAGAELRERITVQDVLWEGGRVVGIEGLTSTGAVFRERARVVVGADGMRSVVAAKVGAATYDALETRTTTYYGYWDGVRVEAFEAYFHPELPRVVLAFPTNDALVCTFIQWPRDEFASVRADPERSMRDAIAVMPGLGDRFGDARLAERVRGTGDHPNFFRRPYGPGWALVGDAGYHRDSLTAQGIKDAFLSADLLASALGPVLAEGADEERALAEYERSRNEAVRPAYEATCRMISFPPPSPEAIRLRSALQRDQEATDQFCGVMFDTVPPAQFFAPENIARITSPSQIGAPAASAD